MKACLSTLLALAAFMAFAQDKPSVPPFAIDAALQSKGRLLLDAPIAIEPER